MEQTIKEILPQVVRQTGVAVAGKIAAVSPPEIDKSFVQALEGKRIKDATADELFEAVSTAVETTWFELGLKPISDGDMELLKFNICKDYAACWGSMFVAEIGNAFWHWSRGKYGKIFGLTVIVAGRLMSDYLTDQSRLEAVRSLKPKELPAAKPDKKQLFDTAKTCLWLALDKYQLKEPPGTLAPTVYNFLDALGLMLYDSAEKWEFMAKGLAAEIEALRIRIIKETDEHRLSGMKKQLKLLIDANSPDAVLKDAECIALVKNKAKELTLLDWFEHCAESELNIDELVEGKRAAYEKG
jgi:hypothetical protein